MRILAFLLEDGTYEAFDVSSPFFSAYSLVKEVKDHAVKTIIFGEKDNAGNVLWEKNFTGAVPYNIDALRGKE
jgi:hypothetical protein